LSNQISRIKLTEIENISNYDEKFVPSSTVLSGKYFIKCIENNLSILCMVDYSDKVKMFYCNQTIDETSDVICLHFIGLKLGIHKCFVILTTTDHSDYVLSATVEVKDPLPMLPHVSLKSHLTTVNTVTKTLHFNAAVGERVEEELAIHSSNEALENALVNMSKWELNKDDLNQLIQTDTLKFAALSNKFSRLFEKNLCYISDNNLNFSVEQLGSRHFEVPSAVIVPLYGKLELYLS